MPTMRMLCEKCGATLNEEMDFCGKCGTKVQKAEQPQTAEPEIGHFAEGQFETENTRKTPQKRKLLWLKICVPAVAVLAALAVVLVNFPVWFGFNKADTPKDYFAYVEGKAMSAYTEPLLTVYDGMRLAYANGAIGTSAAQDASMDMSMQLELDNSVALLLRRVLGTDVSGMNGLTIEYSLATKAGVSQELLHLAKDGHRYLTTETLTAADGTLYERYPQFQEKYLKSEAVASGKEQMANMAALPEGARIKALLDKYIRVVIDNLGEVQQSTETVTLSDVSQSLTVLDVTLQPEYMRQMLTAVLDTAKQDAELRALLQELQTTLGTGDMHTKMLEGIEQLLARADQLTVNLPTITMRSYVNDADEVVGRAVTVEGHSFSMLTVRNGEAFATEMKLDTAFAVTGNGTEQNGVVNANYAFSVDDEKLFTLSASDLKVDAVAETVSGTLLLTPENGLWQKIGAPSAVSVLRLGIKLQFDIHADGGDMKLAIVRGDQTFLGLNIHISEKDTSAVIQLPQEDAVLDMADFEERNEWIDAIPQEKFNEAYIAAGIPAEIVYNRG